MDYKTVESYILSFEHSKKKILSDEEITFYSINDVTFAIMPNTKDPVRLSLRADRQLSNLLRSKYESVMPASGLDPKQWNTIILSGQLSWDEVKSLIRHSYDLAKNTN